MDNSLSSNENLNNQPNEDQYKSIYWWTIGLLGAGNEEFMTDPFFE